MLGSRTWLIIVMLLVTGCSGQYPINQGAHGAWNTHRQEILTLYERLTELLDRWDTIPEEKMARPEYQALQSDIDELSNDFAVIAAEMYKLRWNIEPNIGWGIGRLIDRVEWRLNNVWARLNWLER